MTNNDLKEKLIQIAKNKIHSDDVSHDFEHTCRVLLNAEKIAKREGEDLYMRASFIFEMAEKEEVIKEKLDHSGIFDFKGFYSYAHSWLKEEKYGVVEEKYSEKVSGNTRDITVKWLASKILSDYFKIEIEVEFVITKLSDVEVEIDGERKKSNKGKVSVEIKGVLILDPRSKWDKSEFWRFTRDVYNKYVVPARVENKRDVIRKVVMNFKEELKAFLELSGRR